MLTFLSFLTLFAVVFSARRHRPVRRRFIGEADAIVVHGPNKWNNKPVIDYTGILNNFVLKFGIHEINAYNETGDIEETITELTDTSRLAATTRELTEITPFPPSTPVKTFLPPFPPFTFVTTTLNDFYNVPLSDVGTFFLGSLHVFDRRPIKEYDEYMGHGEVFRKKYSSHDITIADWNKASGYLKVKQLKRTGLYEVSIEICSLKSSVYSVWEAGVLHAMTVNETGFGTPAGGIPNIIQTDMYGYGKIEFTQKWNPFECYVGGDCTVQYSLQYHMDGSIYGGSPALGGQMLFAGTISANHLYIPTVGTIVQEAQHKFMGSQCMFSDD